MYVQCKKIMRYAPFIQYPGAQVHGGLREWPRVRLQQLRRFREEHRFLVSSVAASLFAGIVVASGMSSTFSGFGASPDFRRESAAAGVVKQDMPIQGLNIAGNGLTYIQGARVARVSNSYLEVVSEWNAGMFRWTINLHAETRFVLPNGEAGTLSDINVGDFVAITGTLSGNSPGVLIEGDVVRLVSSQTSDAPVVYLQEVQN